MKKLLLMCFLFLNVTQSFALAESQELGGLITLESLRNGNSVFGDRNTTVNLDVDLNDHIRAVLIATILEQNLDRTADGDEFQRISEMVYSSYIEIRNIGNKPVALILGKFASIYGTESSRFENYLYRDEFELTSRPQRVLGFSVELDEEILGATFAVSLYRPYMSRGENLGLPGGVYSIKKEILKNLVLKYSSMINLDLQSAEIKRSLELIYTNKKIETWVNVQKFDNVYMAGDLIDGLSFQVGVEYALKDNISLIVQYSVVENVLSKYETGIEFEIYEGKLFLFPSVSRYDREGKVENSYRVLFTLKF